MRVSCTVNGEPRQADDVWEGESLLYVLRERLGLPGSKNACEQGECGSCSVYLDGVLVCACLVLAGQAEGSEITTVEGLAADDTLHPVQEAFVEAGAVQCGFCTPGLVVATHDLLARNPSPTDPEIREALAGNLCRCTGYEKVLAAVRLAVGRLAAGDPAAGGPGGGVWTAPGTPSDPGLPSRSGAPGTRGRDDARSRALEAVKAWGAEQAGVPEEPGA
jgi:aerobic carbon-monoxide dehydrogenase small subunit